MSGVIPGAEDMRRGLDVRLLYDIGGDRRTLFLGSVSTVNAATAALRSAADEVQRSGGANMRVEFRRKGKVIFESAVRSSDVGAA